MRCAPRSDSATSQTVPQERPLGAMATLKGIPEPIHLWHPARYRSPGPELRSSGV